MYDRKIVDIDPRPMQPYIILSFTKLQRKKMKKQTQYDVTYIASNLQHTTKENLRLL